MENRTASVLVLDPQPLMRDSICAAIEAEAGLQVVKPAGGEAEVSHILSLGQEEVIFLAELPDIILLGVGNPGLKELAVLSDLHLQWPSMPILALTSHEVPGQEEAALQSGARAVLTKVATREELMQSLRDLASFCKGGSPCDELVPAGEFLDRSTGVGKPVRAQHPIHLERALEVEPC